MPPPLARWPTTSEPRCLAHRYVDLVLAAAVAEKHRPLLRQVTAMAHRQTSQNAHAPRTPARGAALAEAGAGAVAAARQPLPLHLTPPATPPPSTKLALPQPPGRPAQRRELPDHLGNRWTLSCCGTCSPHRSRRCAMSHGVRRAFVHALRGLHSPHPAAGITAERTWKLFLLVPRLLLTRTRETGPAGRTALLQRLQAFEAGRWCELLDAAMPSTAQPQRSPGSDVERMRERACAGPPLRLLSDPDKRPPHPRHPIPDDVVRFRAANPLRLRAAELGEALRTAKRGSAAGLSGASVEHYRLLLEDEEALELLAHAASLLANADVPADVLRALALSRLTALSKPGGGVRGIATGDTLRRLVSRTLARRYAETFNRATRPFQFALQARTETDCLAAMLRAASELDADATIVSLDGRSAYDTVSRAAFLTKLREVAPDFVPFVRKWCGGTYLPSVGLGWPMPRNLARRRL